MSDNIPTNPDEEMEMGSPPLPSTLETPTYTDVGDTTTYTDIPANTDEEMEMDSPVPTPLGTIGTDFLTFATGGGANIEDQTSYANDPQRLSGNLPGIARSNFNNKAIRQGTFVAHSLCLWISEQLTQYVPDDGSDVNWIGSYNSALSKYIFQVIPPAPNLGAYLPLAGGTMTGNISFVTGVSTILANNTWYYSLDTGGQARGIILKGSDNNIYINDGSATYIFQNGIPVLNNNISYAGKDTGNTIRPLIGLLSDNSTHIAGGGHIYLDVPAGYSAWVNGNVVIPNNTYLYARDVGGTNHPLIGLNTANQLIIGSGAPVTTDIYAAGGQAINLHNTTVALGQMNVNGTLYAQGGGRAYIPGGNDPWIIYADNGFYARIHYTAAGTRDWTCGALSNGIWALADETAHAIRYQMELNGTGHYFNSLQVDGSATVGGGVTIGGLTVTGAAQVNGGLNVYNGLNVQTGNFNVNGATGLGGLVSMYNGLNVNSGTTNVQALNCSGLGCTGGSQINGGLTLYNGLNVASGNVTIAGTLYGAGFSIGSGTVNGNLTVTNTLQVNNFLSVYNGLTVQTGGFIAGGAGQVNGGLTVYNGLNVQTGNASITNGGLGMAGALSVSGTSGFGGAATCYTSLQNNGQLTQYGYFWCNNNADIFGYCNVWNGLQVWNSLYVQSGNLYVGNGYSFYVSGQSQFGSLYVPDSRGIILINLNQVNQEPGIRMYAPSHVWSQYIRADGYMMVAADESVGTGRMTINPTDGQVAFNTVKVESYGYFWARDGYCNKPGGGPWWDNSDERLKKNVRGYDTGLAAIRKLRPVTYEFNGLHRTRDDGTVYHGLVAQEAMKVMPEMIFEGHRFDDSAFDDPEPEDVPLYYVMNGNALTYALINAVKELADELDALKGKGK
jgi:hypothetical protein